MVRSPIMRHELIDRVSRLLWHTACHLRYVDQSFHLVEGRASAVDCFSYGEKNLVDTLRSVRWLAPIAFNEGSRAPHSATSHKRDQRQRHADFVQDPPWHRAIAL
jgi:hypothetical protein